MSRREARESDSGRHRSRFDREPSPKRSRRDGKPETDRVKTGTNHDNRDLGQKHRHQLQDTLPLGSDTPLARDSKQENGTAKKDSDMKPDKQYDGTKHSSAPTEVSRSRSYSQHHERGSGGQVGRSSGRRATGERGSWKDSTDWHIEKAERATHDREQRDERSHAKVENISSRHNDGISERKDDVLPTTKKRPAFREKKIVVDPGNAEAAASETLKSNQIDRPVERSDRREERARHLDRTEKQFGGDRGITNRGEAQRDGFSSRGRYAGGSGNGNYKGTDGFNGRQGYRPGGFSTEKWKHDLYQEVNVDPTPSNEEDQIAQLEALLSS